MVTGLMEMVDECGVLVLVEGKRENECLSTGKTAFSSSTVIS